MTEGEYRVGLASQKVHSTRWITDSVIPNYDRTPFCEFIETQADRKFKSIASNRCLERKGKGIRFMGLFLLAHRLLAKGCDEEQLQILRRCAPLDAQASFRVSPQ